MAAQVKTVWRMGIRDKKDWNKWSWSKEYDTFEELTSKSSAYLKAHPGVVTRIITRAAYLAVTGK